MLLFGGIESGIFSLISDNVFVDNELYLLKEVKNNYSRKKLNTGEIKPPKRYGHSISFTKHYLILFGGNTENAITNETWCINLENPNPEWQMIEMEGPKPSPRFYHTANKIEHGVACGMIVIAGGKEKNSIEASKEIWGLKYHRNETWNWVEAPILKNNSLVNPMFQHSAHYRNNCLTFLGGRINDKTLNSTINCYDTDENFWESLEFTSRFRHVSWSFGHLIFIHGGFEETDSNTPVAKILSVSPPVPL